MSRLSRFIPLSICALALALSVVCAMDGSSVDAAADAAADEEAQTHTTLIAAADRQPLSRQEQHVQYPPQRFHLLYALHAVTLLLLILLFIMLFARPTS